MKYILPISGFDKKYIYIFLLLFSIASLISWKLMEKEDPLPSWEKGSSKSSIIEFINRVTEEGNADFIPEEDRIAMFNHDGTLWPELPPAEGVFVLNRIKEFVKENPKLKNKQPYKDILDKDLEYFEKGGIRSVMEVMAIAFRNKTQEEFRADAEVFFRTEQHPRYKAPFAKLAYQPMVELLAYLKAKGFKTWICSGGSTEFIRVISNEMYGIPPEQVIGSRFDSEFVEEDRQWFIRRKAKLASFNDKNEKPVNISNYLGKKPVFACGNVKSGGDIPMLYFIKQQKYPSMVMIINHDDGINEFSYEDKAMESLKTAKENNWMIVSIKNDWKEIFKSTPSLAVNTVELKQVKSGGSKKGF